ncbi:MAG TPA: STAS domain-containing protein [Spirochaetota bacterium]|nr:STAS domain-containing protein [Spirochaetota bacterium]HPC40802.1 STAS domain-containing protein [Spirochaetota bacterium]HPL15749.1 STAS domain-containing protein [Spirochaetota bacterium]HQF07808.1 STAS domain-containing protein [Spirochaetota bacterium]HQH96861.1 STAS domain-containing protein [Spirochaetota bacterium]
MDGDFNIADYRGLLIIEVMVEKFDFFLISEHSVRLRGLLEERHHPSIIFDFTGVRFIDSSVFGFLLEVRTSVEKHGNDIAIVCSDPEVLHIMRMLKVTQIMQVFGTRDKAADYLNSLQDM